MRIYLLKREGLSLKASRVQFFIQIPQIPRLKPKMSLEVSKEFLHAKQV